MWQRRDALDPLPLYFIVISAYVGDYLRLHFEFRSKKRLADESQHRIDVLESAREGFEDYILFVQIAKRYLNPYRVSQIGANAQKRTFNIIEGLVQLLSR